MFAKVKSKLNSIISSDKFVKASVTNLAVSSCAIMMSVPVGAEEVAGDVSNISGAFTTITSIMSSIWTFMIGNPLMCCYMCVGLAAASAGLIKKFKRSSR